MSDGCSQLYPIREHFDAPERVSVLWTYGEAPRQVTCEIWTHWSGFELRLLFNGGLLRSQVCRSHEQLAQTEEEWRLSVASKDWS